MKNTYRIQPFGKKWTKVYQYVGTDLIPIKSWLVAAEYYGGNVLEFIEKNEHIEQFCIEFYEF